MNKSYSELMQFSTWQERLDYLYLGDNKIGDMTFGGHRWLNQNLYNSIEWKHLRRQIIIRDNGCDMGCIEYPIANRSKIIIHHINPITIDDLLNQSSKVFDLDNLISVSFNTHQMIHYGTKQTRDILRLNGERSPNDTKLW
jgi:hypothetical protein